MDCVDVLVLVSADMTTRIARISTHKSTRKTKAQQKIEELTCTINYARALFIDPLILEVQVWLISYYICRRVTTPAYNMSESVHGRW